MIIIKKYLSIGYRFWLNCLNVWLNCISIRKTDNSTKCRKMRISEILEFWKRLFLKRLINVKRELSISGTREHHTDVNWTEPSLLVECRACRIVLQSKNLSFFQNFFRFFFKYPLEDELSRLTFRKAFNKCWPDGAFEQWLHLAVYRPISDWTLSSSLKTRLN